MAGVKMKSCRRRSPRSSSSSSRRSTTWLSCLTMPLQMLFVAAIVSLVLVTGMAKAEFHQPYYQNGFGFDSQLPLMPNHPGEDQLIEAATGNRGGSLDNGLINAANAAWTGGGGGDTLQSINYSSYSTYMNRKEVLMPLIADLIRFHNLTTEVYEAYVLNVDQHIQMDRNGTRDDTAGGGVVVTSVVIDSSSSVASGTASMAGPSSQEQQHLEQLLLNDLSYLDLSGAGGAAGAAQDESMSVVEQNLADLNDYCDSNLNNNNRNSAESSPLHSFTNLSYNLIPKDLLEATDLFWSNSPSAGTPPRQLFIEGAGAVSPLRTRENDGDDDPEDKTYLEYINKDSEEGELVKEEDGAEEPNMAAAEAVAVTEEERLDTNQDDTHETDAKNEANAAETEGTTATRIKEQTVEEEEQREESQEGEIIEKLEEFEESDLIEEVTEDWVEDENGDLLEVVKEEEVEDEELESVAEVVVKEESPEDEEEEKPVIFNVLDAEDDEEDRHHIRDWFLNGNEVISRRRRVSSSTFDDIRFDEIVDEVIGR